MKRFKTLLCTALMVTTCFGLFGCGTTDSGTDTNTVVDSGADTEVTADTEKNDVFSVVSSFYPMHIMAMNLIAGIDGVTETSMSEPDIGCIHDHTFTTDDLKKIEGADVYIENGLGLEAFNDKIKEAYPNTVIIEAATNITDADINPHVWTNIDYYISQVQYASEQLQTVNPDNKDAYAANADAYVAELEKLKTDNEAVIIAATGKKALVLDEALPNLCEFLKMDVIEIETDHEEEALSADDLKETINTMNSEGIKTIFIGKDADRATAEAIATETGATIYELNTCMVGTADSSADSYITEMKENFEIISTIE